MLSVVSIGHSCAIPIHGWLAVMLVSLVLILKTPWGVFCDIFTHYHVSLSLYLPLANPLPDLNEDT